MNNRKISSNRRKSATVGLVICFVAAIALVGAYTFQNYKSGVQKELAMAEKETQERDRKQKQESKAANSIAIDNQKKQEAADAAKQAQEEVKKQEAAKQEAAKQEASQQQSTSTATAAKKVTFSQEDNLVWPVSGDILLNYSMDKTVYFATLDQYKYNPAVVISGEAGAPVLAAANGIVKSVETSAQTGITVAVDIGGGYEAVYGQLQEVSLENGSYIKAGDALGKLSEPTKYYSVEGCNLYFQLLKDGQPINPLDYLES